MTREPLVVQLMFQVETDMKDNLEKKVFMRCFCQGIGVAHHVVPLRSLVVLFLFIAACPAIAQPVDPSRTREKPRLWEVRAAQRYRTVSGFADRNGSMAWHESTVGVSGGLFLPGPGLLRAGAAYAHTRFAFASDTRLGLAGSEPFRRVQEMRLSAQLITPWSSIWSSQVFGAIISAFESGAASDSALSGIAGLGVMRRFSDRLSIGFGALLLHPLGKRAVTVVPIVLADWQMTERLALRSRQDITLTYLLDSRRSLSVAAVGSFFGRKQFRLDERGEIPGGVADLKGFEVGGRITWEPFPALTLQGAVEAALRQNLYLEDRAGREIVDVDLEDALRLSLVVRYRF